MGCFGECECRELDESKVIRATICAESRLIQGGKFYLPTEIVDGVQRYRLETADYDQTQQSVVLGVSSEWYYKDDKGRFVVGGVN